MPVRWPSWQKPLSDHLETCPRWKDRTDSPRLFSDLYIFTIAPAPISIHTQHVHTIIIQVQLLLKVEQSIHHTSH